MTKEKIYDILTAGLLVCTGLTDFGGYIVYDIYHIMKNGGWYRGFLFHDLMLEICIGPALFILCGVFRFLKMRKANVLMSFAMFVYHVVNYYPNPVFVYRLTNLLEIIGIAGFLFFSVIECIDFPEWKIEWEPFVMCEAITLLLMLVDAANSPYLSRRVSSLVFLLYKIPLLSALLSNRALLEERKEYCDE